MTNSAATTEVIGEQAIWKGWYRPSKRHHWKSLAEDQDYGTCLNKLLDAVMKQPRSLSGESLVSQSDPNSDAKARRPRRCF